MRILQKASRFLFKALEWFAMICMVVLTVVVFCDVVLRYIFKQGFSWTQEIATLMLVWFSLIGMAIGVLEKIHISIEMFTSHLPEKVISIIKDAHQRAAKILSENEPLLHEIAKYLLEKETITGDEFMKILRNYDAQQNA